MSTSPRPTGSSKEMIFHGETWDETRGLSAQLRDSSTVSWRKTPGGIFAHAKIPGSSSTPNSNPIQGPFQIQSVQGDYLTCYAYDYGSKAAKNSTPVYIAKEWKHRKSLTKETIFGVEHDYTYQDGTAPPGGLNVADANNIFRTDNYGGSTEYQRIVPPWVCGNQGEIVYAVKANTGINTDAGKAVSLLIIGRSCQWAIVNS